MDAAAALAVLGEPGWDLLLAAGAALDSARPARPARPGVPLAAASALAAARPQAPAPQRTAALELVSAGRRLAAKLGLDDSLLAVSEAVEQASSGRVAIWHASRLPEGARVLEIGCGCGGDSLALAHRAQNLIATDVDPVRAACAHTNLLSLDLANARAVPEDGFAILASDGARADVVFADPSRRTSGRRSLHPEAWEPPLSRLVDLAREGRVVLVKAAPSLDPSDVAGVFRVSYVSHGGECVEAFLDSRTADGPDVEAVMLPPGAPEIVLRGDRGPAPTGEVGRWIFRPDPAAVRASLLAELCTRHGAHLLDGSIALLAADERIDSPWLAPYEVLESMPLRPVDLAAALRRHGASRIETHCRGVSMPAADLSRRLSRGLSARGGGPVLDVFATRCLDRPVGIVARRPGP